jgi:hypothetical protein
VTTSSDTYTTLKSRFSAARLAQYEAATRDNSHALALYDWNMSASAALFEDIGAFEILLRNAIDLRLRDRYQAIAAASPWYHQAPLQDRAADDVAAAIDKVTHKGRDPEDQDKVVAELSFGFWRYLLSSRYHTTLWPTMLPAFSHRPSGAAAARRQDIEVKVQSLYVLRNRIAHHEPIFKRDLDRDHRGLVAVAGLICPRTQAWIVGRSRVRAALSSKPPVTHG